VAVSAQAAKKVKPTTAAPVAGCAVGSHQIVAVGLFVKLGGSGRANSDQGIDNLAPCAAQGRFACGLTRGVIMADPAMPIEGRTIAEANPALWAGGAGSNMAAHGESPDRISERRVATVDHLSGRQVRRTCRTLSG
jgi:hypothetical protein